MTEPLKKIKLAKHYPHGEHPRRNILGVIYLLQCLLCGISINPLTPISVTIRELYDVSATLVNMTTSVVLISSVLLSFPSIWLIKRKGINFSIKYAMIFMSIGFFLRVFINYNIYFVVAGQGIIGFVFPIVTNMQAKFVTQWFSGKMMGKWITMCSMAIPFGTLVGFLLPVFGIGILNKKKSDSEKKDIMFYYLLVESCLSFFVAFLTLILWTGGNSRLSLLKIMKDQRKRNRMGLAEGLLAGDDKETNYGSTPLDPTSDFQSHVLKPKQQISEDESEDFETTRKIALERLKKSTSICYQLRHIFSRGFLILLLLNYSVVLGSLQAQGTLAAEIYHIYGVKQTWGAINNSISIVAGIAGTFLYSAYLMRRKNQIIFLHFVLILTAMIMIIFFLLISNDYPNYCLTITTGFLGFVSFNTISITLTESINLVSHYYLPTINVLMLIGNKMVGSLMIYVMGILLKNPTKHLGMMYFVFNGGLFFILFLISFWTHYLSKKERNRNSVLMRNEIDAENAKSLMKSNMARRDMKVD